MAQEIDPNPNVGVGEIEPLPAADEGPQVPAGAAPSSVVLVRDLRPSIYSSNSRRGQRRPAGRGGLDSHLGHLRGKQRPLPHC